MDYEIIASGPQGQLLESPSISIGASSPSNPTIAMRKRGLKPELNSRQMFFCGKRKRSNRDRYQEHDIAFSMPRNSSHLEEYSMRPRSFSSTSKPHSDRLQLPLPLNKGLLSKIERISQLQKTEVNANNTTAGIVDAPNSTATTVGQRDIHHTTENEAARSIILDVSSTFASNEGSSTSVMAEEIPESGESLLTDVLVTQQKEKNFRNHRKKRSGHHNRRLLQFVVDQNSMDCEEFNSSSSLSSSDSDEHAVNDTDREGDDELTDWPGNESNCGDLKYDSKRKLTKRNTLNTIKSDPESASSLLMAEDDTVMSNNTTVGDDVNREISVELPYQSSEPISITNKLGFSSLCRADMVPDDVTIPMKQIESEMSGETSNPFLSSPPCQPSEVREIRAGCRRVKGERPGFSIKTSVNERLARFLQDPRLLQIRLPDIEIYEHESLINLARLYSLQMTLDNGCAVLNKTRQVISLY